MKVTSFKVKLKVLGLRGSGKTSVLAICEEALKAAGYTIERQEFKQYTHYGVESVTVIKKENPNAN